jgi:ankyrin repeat protein
MQSNCFPINKLKFIKEYFYRKNRLIDAVYNNDIDEVNKLINNGYEIDYKSYYNWNGSSALMIACYYGYYEIVKILIDNGANVNFTDNNKRTPLCNAILDLNIKKKEPSIVINILDELIKNGANKNIITNLERTPLLDAINEGNSQIVRFLLQHRFLELEINQEIKSGWYKGKSILDLAKNNCAIKRYLSWYSNDKGSQFYFIDI